MANLLLNLVVALGVAQMALAQSETTTASASKSSGVLHRVDVGEDGLVYDPNVTMAAVGDKIEFHFYQGMHSVTRAKFDEPCVPINGSDAIYSGRVPVNSGEGNEVFTVTVKNKDPIWFYCATQQHCQSGMVGVINPPSSGDETIDRFASAAESARANIQPSSTGGGVLGAAASSSATTSSSSESGTETGTATGASASASSTGGGSGAADLRCDMDMMLGCFGIAVASVIFGMLM